MAKRAIARHRPGVRRPDTTQPAAQEGLLEKLKRTEQELAGVRNSDPNAKWKLARMRQEQLTYDTNDTEYWFAIAFDSREQKETFLRAIGCLDLGDKYLWGPDVAERIGFALAPDGRAYHTLPVSRRWARFALPGTADLKPK